MVIIGAGPAGLTAAYELCRHGVPSVVLEADSVVGGLARTIEYKGYLFDLGGHRFYTTVDLVEKIWHEVLGPDLLRRPRLSRIYYRSKFFRYPLEPFDALAGLGPREAFRCGLSCLRSRLAPRLPENDLESWISNRFGARLYEIFFKSYSEKVWGLPCREIDSAWAAQRIGNLDLSSMLRGALRSFAGRTPRTLIREFHYPRRGPGMLWSRMKRLVESRGARVVLNAPVERIAWEEGRVRGVTAGGLFYEATHVIGSMAIPDLIQRLDPAPEAALRRAAGDFHYRDFLTVALIVRQPRVFPDNWLYIHDPGVRVGRIQNYKNWSPEMTPDPNTTCLGLEYFCNQGDDLWTMPDEALTALASQELTVLGLANGADVMDGAVVRVPRAYPIYDGSYRRGLQAVRAFLQRVPNLQLAGRNGMHRYNNQDHSMLTAILAARNILGASYDLWQADPEAGNLEEASAVPGGVIQTAGPGSRRPARPGVEAPGADRPAAAATASTSALH